MSYCRFSSDDFHCDVYVYESCEGGWMTHIAGNRIVGDAPIPTIDWNDPNFFAQFKAQLTWIRAARREPIDLPLAGTYLHDDTPTACADHLEELRALGYIIPQYAIAALRLDALDAPQETTP